ncbi:MBL fold metallo-hydrolase [Cytobacillus sp. S13-E01]|uniref:MBL fold metallo-hydrolase n=1 Tax=Cytobacillus sp. S13-E01 TaxID=3031326 RepID=UPI0023D810EB|nr:MBL fold metallo-hydrolase [Cytobacillus sp. S13-E01]MDF0726935.1 MBL fold metallo-hydrolase [Cytobacillus sp. S13-E01]
MKVTVVGFWGGFPGVNEATSGYLIQDNGFNLLLDCGSGVVAQLQNYIKVEELDAVIISHYHHDHIADIGPLQYARLISKSLVAGVSELPIYGHTLDRDGFTKLQYKGCTVGIDYQPEGIQIGPFSISFLMTKHPVPCYAMRISNGNKTVVFTADTSYFEELTSFSVEADLLICECNLYEGQNGAAYGHMTSSDAGNVAGKANVKNLLLTHLPHFGNHQLLIEQAATYYSGLITLAKSGYVWN